MNKIKEDVNLMLVAGEKYKEYIAKLLMTSTAGTNDASTAGIMDNANSAEVYNSICMQIKDFLSYQESAHEKFAFVYTTECLEALQTLFKQLCVFIMNPQYFAKISEGMSRTWIEKVETIRTAATSINADLIKHIVEFNFMNFRESMGLIGKMKKPPSSAEIIAFLSKYDKFNLQVMNLLKLLEPTDKATIKLFYKFKLIIFGDDPNIRKVEANPLYIPRGNIKPGEFMKYEELARKYELGSRDKKIVTVPTGRAVIIVIYQYIGTPLEYDIRGLIDQQYIETNNLSTSSSVGISNSVLRRTTTLIEHPRKQKFNTAVVINGKYTQHDDFIIIETFDDVDYRIYTQAHVRAHELAHILTYNDCISYIEGIDTFPVKYADDMIKWREDINVSKFDLIASKYEHAQPQMMLELRDKVVAGMNKILSAEKTINTSDIVAAFRATHDIVYAYVDASIDPELTINRFIRVNKLMKTMENKLLFIISKSLVKGDYKYIINKLFDVMNNENLWSDMKIGMKNLYILN